MISKYEKSLLEWIHSNLQALSRKVCKFFKNHKKRPPRILCKSE